MTEKQFNAAYKAGEVTAGIGIVSYNEPAFAAHVTVNRSDAESMSTVWDRLAAEIDRVRAAIKADAAA